jgi:hypothetical protein
MLQYDVSRRKGAAPDVIRKQVFLIGVVPRVKLNHEGITNAGVSHFLAPSSQCRRGVSIQMKDERKTVTAVDRAALRTSDVGKGHEPRAAVM